MDNISMRITSPVGRMGISVIVADVSAADVASVFGMAIIGDRYSPSTPTPATSATDACGGGDGVAVVVGVVVERVGVMFV